MNGSIIRDATAFGYQWVSRRTLGTSYVFTRLFPRIVNADENLMALCFPDVPDDGPERAAFLLNPHIWRPLLPTLVCAAITGTDNLLIKREVTYADCVMTLISAPGVIPAGRMVIPEIGPMLLEFYRRIRCATQVNPGLLDLVLNRGVIVGLEDEFAALQAAVAAEAAPPTELQKQTTAAALLAYAGAASEDEDTLAAYDEIFAVRILPAFTMSAMAVLSKTGEMTGHFVRKLKDGAPPNCIVDMILNSDDSSRVWKRITGILAGVAVNANDIFTSLQAIYPIDLNLRTFLTLSQAVFAQASAVMIPGSVMKKYPGCLLWPFIRSVALAEYNAWVAALAVLAANPYAAVRIGNTNTAAFEAKNFQTLLAGALQLDSVMNNNSTLRGYAGRPQTPHQARIAQICNAYLQGQNAPLVEADFRAGGQHYHDVMADIPAAINF